jgi:hypothetical protein
MCYIYVYVYISGLWHGVSAGILKSVPKYITAIVIKDFMDDHLPRGDPKDKVQLYYECHYKDSTVRIVICLLQRGGKLNMNS